MRRMAASAHTRSMACERVFHPIFACCPARPLAVFETAGRAKGQGYHAVLCSVKKASRLKTARSNRCLLAPALVLRQGACQNHPTTTVACLLFPHGRLSLPHAQSHVLLPCRQSAAAG
jgi:hypothetical protein